MHEPHCKGADEEVRFFSNLPWWNVKSLLETQEEQITLHKNTVIAL